MAWLKALAFSMADGISLQRRDRGRDISVREEREEKQRMEGCNVCVDRYGMCEDMKEGWRIGDVNI